MNDHNLISMSTVAKQQRNNEEERNKKQLSKKDAVQQSGYSTKIVEDMIELNESQIDSLKTKIDQTMNNFDEKLYILQKKNEISIAENFKDIIFGLSNELEKMTKCVESLTQGQGVTTQNQLRLSIKLVKEYKEEYQKVYDAFLKASRENKQWNIKVHTLRDRVRDLEEQIAKQESYLDFFKKKYNINVDNELAKLQQIEKEKNIALMEDIKIYVNKNNGKDNEPSTYQKFIKNFIFDKYTFTVLDLFTETEKLIYNLKKQYQFNPGEKSISHTQRSKMISQFREQRAENYYYQLFVKCVNEVKNQQLNLDDSQIKEQKLSIIQNIAAKNTMLQIQPDELLKLFLSDNNVQQLIRKHIFFRQSQLHSPITQNNSSIDQIQQHNQSFCPSTQQQNHSFYPSTTTSREKYSHKRKNIELYHESIKRITQSKPESPVADKEKQYGQTGSSSQFPSPINTPQPQTQRVRVSSELGSRDTKQPVKNIIFKTRIPINLIKNELNINTQDESFEISNNQSGVTVQLPNSSRLHYSSGKQNSHREVDIINNYINQNNPRWIHNPTNNEKLKAQTQQNRFFQTSIHNKFSPIKQ